MLLITQIKISITLGKNSARRNFHASQLPAGKFSAAKLSRTVAGLYANTPYPYAAVELFC